MTKVTVGIPAYKTTYLVESISSVLTQSFTDFELLVSDDSPDGSVTELVSRIRDPRIRLIQGPRKGLVPNSAHIWENARAPLLKYVYDDDKLYSTALFELLELIEKDDRFVFAFSHRDIIDEHGRVVRRPKTYQGDQWRWFEGTAIAEHAMRTIQNPVGEPTGMLIRRSAFPDASCLASYAGFQIQHLIDVAFFMNAAPRGRAVASPNRLCAFREHSEQVSSNRRSPRWSAGMFEWEIFLRGAVQAGLVSPKVALAGVDQLDSLYIGMGRGLDEIQRFRAGLPALREMLAADRTEVVDDAFRASIAFAECTIDARAAQPAPVDATADSGRAEHRSILKLETVTRQRARGWAWLPDAPEKNLRVEAMVEGRVIGQALANMRRFDIRDVGAGNYSFDLTYYEPILGPDLPSFRVVIEDEEFTPPGDVTFPPIDYN